ncbi:MAG TPA: transposase [Vicinamibacterales bacterium]|nr:transposase [Vicinamibacterales bacterium]
MARPLRLHLPGTVYHVMSRGNNKQTMFVDDDDCERFLELLGKTLARFKIVCLAFCLMRNHYHLLVSPTEHPVSRLMQQLNSTYCLWFNRKHARVGHVLQGRFTSRHVDSDSYLLAALRYIVLNPVAGGQATRPEEWPWSSYRATAGLAPAPGFLALERVWPAFDTNDRAMGRHRFVVFVAAAGSEDTKALEPALMFGSEAFAQRITPLLEPHRETRDFLYRDRFATRPSLAVLFDGRSTPIGRQEAAYDAFGQHAYTLREIGDLVGRAPATVWSWIKNVESRRVTGVRSRFFDSQLL